MGSESLLPETIPGHIILLYYTVIEPSSVTEGLMVTNIMLRGQKGSGFSEGETSA